MHQDQPRFFFETGFYDNVYFTPFPGGDVGENFLLQEFNVGKVDGLIRYFCSSGGRSCLILSSVYTGSGRLARIFGRFTPPSPKAPPIFMLKQGKGMQITGLARCRWHRCTLAGPGRGHCCSKSDPTGSLSVKL